ncbi:9-O-acetylesterase, partial [Bacteroides nordii]|nr:9-O-acetylesterase [Bacteroides nordii]
HDSVRAYAYRSMFPHLINEWRRLWGYEFPFYWESLANINSEDILPKDSPLAELREAQTMTLTLPQPGQAVIYDIG